MVRETQIGDFSSAPGTQPQPFGSGPGKHVVQWSTMNRVETSTVLLLIRSYTCSILQLYRRKNKIFNRSSRPNHDSVLEFTPLQISYREILRVLGVVLSFTHLNTGKAATRITQLKMIESWGASKTNSSCESN
jgi:hypothetical protein